MTKSQKKKKKKKKMRPYGGVTAGGDGVGQLPALPNENCKF